MREGGPVNKIEEIKRKLYDRQDDLTERRREGILHQINREAKDSWEKPVEDPNMPYKMKTSLFKKFFIGAVIFFVCAIAFATFMFFNGSGAVS